jgi:hypothetical protein
MTIQTRRRPVGGAVTSRVLRLCWLLLALLPIPGAVRAAESYNGCSGVISSLPATITTAGIWCLKQDLNTAITNGNAILVAGDNITIECNGFKLGGLVAGVATQTTGINASAHHYVIVRHCNIRGFYAGIVFGGSSTSSGDHLVEDNRFDNNTGTAISVTGDGSIVRRNRVFATGGSTQNQDAIGISTQYSVDIVDNTVSGVIARSGGNGSATGIYTTHAASNRISGNGIRGLLQDGTGKAYGIRNLASLRLAIRDNNVMGNGSTGSVGVYCVDSNGRATDNMIGGFATSLSGCHDSGGNSTLP